MHLLLARVASIVEHKNVYAILVDIKTVFDIGANRGQFALVSRF